MSRYSICIDAYEPDSISIMVIWASEEGNIIVDMGKWAGDASGSAHLIGAREAYRKWSRRYTQVLGQAPRVMFVEEDRANIEKVLGPL